MKQLPAESAAEWGMALCHVCGLASPLRAGRCSRCRSRLHLRNRDSLQRTWAYTIASLLLYFPANMLPILRVESFYGTQSSTILSGVIQFWEEGDYPVAIIIFVASVVIPILKIIAIICLCFAATAGWQPRSMTKLYRVTEFVGRWSMVDVFVVAILVGVVQLGSTISIHPGAGAVSFAAVVVLTMFAAMSFDPRLIWDAAAARAQQSGQQH